MDKEKLKSIVMSILFAMGDPVSSREIKRAVDDESVKESDIRQVFEEIKNELESEKSGIRLLKLENKYQLCTAPENEAYIRKIFDKSSRKSLSNATLETLTIIAYMQPVTRVEIEEIRGVKCDKVVKNLIEQKLIYEAGKLDKIGRPIIYRTTDKFLKLMNLSSLKELPKIDIPQFDEVDNDETDNNGE